MKTSRRRTFRAAVVGGLVAVVAGCGSGGPSTSTGTRPGQVGTSYLVTVSKQPGGTVTSSDGRINCGTAGNLCGPVSYAWTETVTLTATPDAGNMLGAWAGDCLGSQPVCTLDTKTYGADKFVAAVFDVSGQAQHPNFTDPALHGLEFEWWKAEQAGNPLKPTKAFECTACHGATYAGAGLAPSCNDCHARNGHPGWQNDCKFCHGTPPGDLPATFEDRRDANGIPFHPAVSSDVKTCAGCHQDTVDGDGNIIAANGKHMNGKVDGGGHAAGYNDPSIHGRDFFAAIAENPSAPFCTGCHGANYDTVMVLVDRSCNSCHAASPSLTPPGGGWTGTDWKSNCTFCHGTKTIAYASPADLNKAAPPDALSQRLTGAEAPDRTGAHAIHLTGSVFAGPMLCSNCHTVPPTFAHISGRDVRATVIVQGPGASGPEAGYQANGSCLTRCHGANASPAWTFTGISCNGCHGLPPATDIHSGVVAVTECITCHPDTVTAGGTINVASGKHVNGQVDSFQHPAGFGLPANHGPAYLDHLAGATGALNCTLCHGTSLAFCNSCHSQPANGGWVSWQTNCTFCHGTKTPVYSSSDLPISAPPDAVQQRLDGTEVPLRTGQHNLHLSNGGFVPMKLVPCAACHAVPANVADAGHVTVDRRAAVTLSAAATFPNLSSDELARLLNRVSKNGFGSYNPATNGCTAYCHNVPNSDGSGTFTGGQNTNMNWTNDFGCMAIDGCSPAYTPITDCTDCHGSPPPTGLTVVGHTYATAPTNTRYCGLAGCSNHAYHRTALTSNGYDSCANCHFGSAQGGYYAGIHVNGKPDIVYTPAGTINPVTGLPYKSFTATWDPVARTCTTSCHVNSGASTPQSW